MARTQLTVNDIMRSGALLNSLAQAVTAANGAMYRNTGREWLRVGQTSGGNCTLTISIPRTVDGKAVTPQTYTIATATYLYLPPFPTDDYNYPNEMVYVDVNTAATMIVFRDGT